VIRLKVLDALEPPFCVDVCTVPVGKVMVHIWSLWA